MKYKVNYYFDGEGEVVIEAKSKEEAEQKFSRGDYQEKNDSTWEQNFEVNSVKKV